MASKLDIMLAKRAGILDEFLAEEERKRVRAQNIYNGSKNAVKTSGKFVLDYILKPAKNLAVYLARKGYQVANEQIDKAVDRRTKEEFYDSLINTAANKYPNADPVLLRAFAFGDYDPLDIANYLVQSQRVNTQQAYTRQENPGTPSSSASDDTQILKEELANPFDCDIIDADFEVL